MPPLLTIAIPTFNRPGQLCARLSELLPQIADRQEVKVIIVDNASSQPSKDVIAAYFGGDVPADIEIIRNTTNIGLAANICRCFEHSTSIWTWILGDDDAVAPDAIGIVLETLSRKGEENDHVALFCFSSGIDRNAESENFSTIEELFSRFEDPLKFSNFLFISSKVFSTRRFLERARLAYHYCYSLAPHLAVSIAFLQDKLTVRYETGFVVDWKNPPEEQKWSCNLVAAGLPTLAEIPGAGEPLMRHLAPGLGLMLWKPFLRGGIDYVLFDDERGTHYWHLMLVRLIPFVRRTRRISALILLALSGLVIIAPWTRPLLRMLLGGVRIRMSDSDLINDRN